MNIIYIVNVHLGFMTCYVLHAKSIGFSVISLQVWCRGIKRMTQSKCHVRQGQECWVSIGYSS